MHQRTVAKMRLFILLIVTIAVIGGDEGDLLGHMQPIGSHRPPEDNITILSYVPDPVEFYEEYVIMQMPILFKGAILGTPALTKWTDDEYLRYESLRESLVCMYVRIV